MMVSMVEKIINKEEVRAITDKNNSEINISTKAIHQDKTKMLKAVMGEIIQLLYSNECTRDQYPFNGQMRTSAVESLVYDHPQNHIGVVVYEGWSLVRDSDMLRCSNNVTRNMVV